MKLRNYQTQLINDARAELRRLTPLVEGRKPRLVMQLGCGGGKTILAASMAASAIDRGGSAAFLCHRDFLLKQSSDTFSRASIDHSYIANGRWFNPWTTCHIGMIGSMKSRISKIKAPSLCFIDEAHHCVAETWNAVLDYWPQTTFILLSATPGMRTDGKGLEEVADGIVCGPSNAKLIEEGALSDYVWYAPTEPNMKNVNMRMGEVIQSEAEKAMSGKIIGDIVKSYKKYADGALAVYFAQTVKLSKTYAEAFNEAGIPSAHLDADTPTAERESIIRKAADGHIKVLFNVGLFGEGFDMAAMAGKPITIDAVGICRITKSFPLLVQMAMRSMRAKDYPGIILDHAGAYREHNWLPDDDVEWTLHGAERKAVGAGIKQCDNCGAALRRGTLVCTSCGFANIQTKEGKAIERSGPVHVDGELDAIDREEIRRQREEAISDMKVKRSQARTLEDLINIEKDMGYRSGWARHIWKSRQGRT